jgi:hypothetical protein
MSGAARHRQLSAAGKIGSARRWIKFPALTNDMSAARATFRTSFEQGHGCRACGPFVAIDQRLSDVPRKRQIDALRSLHYSNLRDRAVASRRLNG